MKKLRTVALAAGLLVASVPVLSTTADARPFGFGGGFGRIGFGGGGWGGGWRGGWGGGGWGWGGAGTQRLPLGETAGHDEAWLRDQLFDNPQSVPVNDLDPSFGPLVPLCRELRTEAGPVDIAYINQHGLLTLIECKLWRNPEARRKVVAQVIDYARAIARWSYADLQRQVAITTGQTGNVPFQLVRAVHSGLQEQTFVDAAARAMRGGRFQLIVAGDGIREDISAMTEIIN